MQCIFGTFDEDCLSSCCAKPEKPPEDKVLHSLIYTYLMCDNCQFIVVLTTYMVDEFTVDIGIFKRSIFFHKISYSVVILKLTYLVSNSISSTYLTVIQE